jgi:hypothetical protein
MAASDAKVSGRRLALGLGAFSCALALTIRHENTKI